MCPLAFWTRALHASRFVKHYRGPRFTEAPAMGGAASVDTGPKPMSGSNLHLPDSGWSEWYLTFATCFFLTSRGIMGSGNQCKEATCT